MWFTWATLLNKSLGYDRAGGCISGAVSKLQVSFSGARTFVRDGVLAIHEGDTGGNISKDKNIEFALLTF